MAGTPGQLRVGLQSILNASLKSTTLTAYRTKMVTFQNFLGKNTHLITATTEHVALFLTHLHEKGLKSNTIQTYLSAISYHFKINSWPDILKCPLITITMNGLKNLDGKQILRKPITKPLLEKLLHALESICQSHYDVQLYKAIFTTMFFACLRAGEVCKAGSLQHVLLSKNIARLSSGYLLTLDSFKHSRNKTAIMKLSHNPDQSICPVLTLDSYSQVKSNTHFFFTQEDGNVVNRYNLSLHLKNCLQLLNLPPSEFSLHSFRIGRTTELVETASTEQLKLLGRWSSDAYKKYIRPEVVHLPY